MVGWKALHRLEQEAFLSSGAHWANVGDLATWNNAGIARENGEVEQAHRHFKDAVAQALRVRAVKISFPKIVAPTLPPYNASPIKEGRQHLVEARLFEFGSSSKVLFPNPQCSFYVVLTYSAPIFVCKCMQARTHTEFRCCCFIRRCLKTSWALWSYPASTAKLTSSSKPVPETA